VLFIGLDWALAIPMILPPPPPLLLLMPLCTTVVSTNATEKIAIVAAITGIIFVLFLILLEYSMEFIIFQQNKYFELMILAPKLNEN
jgi:hypothetical protein